MKQLSAPAVNPTEIKFVLGGTKYVNLMNKLDAYNRLNGILDDIKAWIDRGFINESYMTATYGMRWAISTARVNSEVVTWIRRQSLSELLKVIDEVSKNCKTMTDVPYYLNKFNIVDCGLNGEGFTIWKRAK